MQTIIKDKLRTFLIAQKDFATADPFAKTRVFCNMTGADFNSIMYEAIECQSLYGREIRNDNDLRWTIL